MRNLITAILIMFSSIAYATPPPNADMALAPWFNSLRQPNSGISCCGEADCRSEAVRWQDGHYQALINNSWMIVPDDKILERTDNPTGHAIVCHAGATIVCFIREPNS